MIFTKEQVAQVRAGRITRTIIPASRKPPYPDTVVPLWRRHTRHDQDGNEIGTTSEIVYDTQSDHPEQPIRLTIQAVYMNEPISELDQATAHACGHKTANALRDWWLADHPRTTTVHVIRFTVGDLRDRDRYIGFTGRAGGDYTTNPRRAADDAAALQPDNLAAYAKQARERDLRRSKHPDQIARDELMKVLEKWDLETRGTASSKAVASAISSIRKQIAVLDRKLKAA